MIIFHSVTITFCYYHMSFADNCFVQEFLSLTLSPRFLSVFTRNLRVGLCRLSVYSRMRKPALFFKRCGASVISDRDVRTQQRENFGAMHRCIVYSHVSI